MKIIVIGRHGQVAKSLHERGLLAGHEILHLGRPEIDLRNNWILRQKLLRTPGDVIINAAAYTQVDKAESKKESEIAADINAVSAATIATAAADSHRPFLHISTDYVFDGAQERPYVETDMVNPLNIYGLTKWLGEVAILDDCPRSTIVRTSWIYSPFGENFVKTMMKAARTKSEMRVVGDQWGQPTNALDLADALLAIAQDLVEKPKDESLSGLFHVSGTEPMSWAGFAERIFSECDRFNLPAARVTHIATTEWPTPARRPLRSILDNSKAQKTFQFATRPFESSLRECVRRLAHEMETPAQSGRAPG